MEGIDNNNNNNENKNKTNMPTQLDPVRVAYINMGNHLYFNRIIKNIIKYKKMIIKSS